MTSKDLKVIFSQNIKKYRILRKLTQAEFAEKVNISIPFLSDIENGKKWVSPVTLVKMAEALNIEAYELIKPESIIPDNAINILEKYTDEIYSIFGETLSNIHDKYYKQIKRNIEK
jgi:transcriptional regulator with XRE-family HTH domain